MKGLDSIMERNPAIKKPHQLYEQFTADKNSRKNTKSAKNTGAMSPPSKAAATTKDSLKDKNEGEQIGAKRERLSVAAKMKRKGIPSTTIAEITGLSEDTINKLS